MLFALSLSALIGAATVAGHGFVTSPPIRAAGRKCSRLSLSGGADLCQAAMLAACGNGVFSTVQGDKAGNIQQLVSNGGATLFVRLQLQA